MFKAISIVGFLAFVLLMVAACSAQLASIERSNLAKDSEFLKEMSEKYARKASAYSNSLDSPYWTLAAQIVSSIDAARQAILGSALNGPEAELPVAFESARKVGVQQISSLQVLLQMGDMNSTKFRQDIAAIESLISRRPGQVY